MHVATVLEQVVLSLNLFKSIN